MVAVSQATRSAVGWSANVAAFAVVLPMRIDRLLTEVELLLFRKRGEHLIEPEHQPNNPA